MYYRNYILIIFFLILINKESINAQESYANPIISADYSDPDVIRVGDDYYMVASSFNMVPGLPLLHSKDLVNWVIVGHGIQELPDALFSYKNRKESELDYNLPRPGKGVFAPSIRFHEGYFWIFWGDPDAGVYMVKAKKPEGPWSKPNLVHKAHGWIDPCPLWDKKTGRAWLANAFANSRAQKKSIVSITEMNWEGTKLISESKLVFDANDRGKYPADREHHLIEGCKFMQRNGYYYIFAPAGGVPYGWQTVLRAKSAEGPYEIRTICEIGNTNVNGPHQGGLVDTMNGEWWFTHFQSTNVLGRIVWLEPAKWVNDWPVIGLDIDGDGIGNPVMEYNFPNTGYSGKQFKIQMSDEFNSDSIGLQWQWPANSGKGYSSQANGKLIVSSYTSPNLTLTDAPNVITQMFPDFEFTATAKVKLLPNENGVARGGLSVMGKTCFDIGIESNNGMLTLSTRKGNEQVTSITLKENELYLKLEASGNHPLPLKPSGDQNRGYVDCQFSYSYDGILYETLGGTFQAEAGVWIGARVGLFCLSKEQEQSYLQVDNFILDTGKD